MSTHPSPGFGSLLRRYRRAAGLTQEELAERAGLGRATIDALERGTRQTPRKETIALLAEALALKESERVLLEATARDHRRDSQPTFTPFSVSEPLAITPAAEHVAAAEAAPLGVLRVLGKQIARLMSSKRGAGLVSGLLVLVLLGSALFFLVGSGRQLQTGGRTLCLATNFPTAGLAASSGKLLEDAVNLAVKQNQHLENGYTLKVINYDEASPLTGFPDPATSEQNIQQMVQNPCIVGLVGPWSSRWAAAVQMPIAANAGLVMISPTNTDPGLTVRTFADLEGVNFDQLHPVGKPLTYFRVAPHDVAQVTVDASLILNYLFAQSVWVVDDSTAYGEELENYFREQFQARGGRLVGSESLSPDRPALIHQVAGRIVDAHPEAVFFAGATTHGGGLLKAQLFTLGYTGPFVGGDAIARDPTFLEQAGAEPANGTYAGQAGTDPATLTSGAAAQFVRDYHALYPDQTPDGYTANAYDAAMVVITALKQLIQAGQALTREAVRAQVQHMQYVGVTGPISFDSNGDITRGVFSIYEVQDGRWVFKQLLTTKNQDSRWNV